MTQYVITSSAVWPEDHQCADEVTRVLGVKPSHEEAETLVFADWHKDNDPEDEESYQELFRIDNNTFTYHTDEGIPTDLFCYEITKVD